MWSVLQNTQGCLHLQLKRILVNTSSTPKSPSDLPAVTITPQTTHAILPILKSSRGRKWFDCAECHYEQESHPLLQRTDMVRYPDPRAHEAISKAYSPSRPLPAKNAKNASGRKLRSSKRGTCHYSKPTPGNASLTPVSDEYCPHCDNHYVLEAITPKPSLQVEGEDVRIDSRMLKDERVRAEQARTIFDVKDAPDRLG